MPKHVQDSARLTRGRRFAAVAVMIGVMGWSVMAEKEPFPYAKLMNSCAPWDGPAIAIYLSTREMRCATGDVAELTLNFWQELPLHDGQTFTLDANSKWGGASHCKGGEMPCEAAGSGTIHIERFTKVKGAGGGYVLEFPKLGRVKGTFDARWCETRILCG